MACPRAQSHLIWPPRMILATMLGSWIPEEVSLDHLVEKRRMLRSGDRNLLGLIHQGFYSRMGIESKPVTVSSAMMTSPRLSPTRSWARTSSVIKSLKSALAA
jgi:hypothetical protein